MNNRYSDLIHQTYDFPQPGFKVKENKLFFNEIDLSHLIKKYGTPLKLSYLPIIVIVQKAVILVLYWKKL